MTSLVTTEDVAEAGYEHAVCLSRPNRMAEAMFDGHRARNLRRAQRNGFVLDWPQWSEADEGVKRVWLEYAADAIAVLEVA